jgi:alpha-beta hydrolase superfamily lysophospholipase
VSRDPAQQQAYDSDPLNNKKATARWFTETATAQRALLDGVGKLTLPLLMMVGAADPVASAQQSELVFARVGASDKTLRMLTGQLHEVLNELPEDRARTVGEIAEWLRAHAAKARSGGDGKLRAG